MIRVLCVGKIKESFYREAIEEYCKRLNKYTKLEIIECRDYNDKDSNVLLKEKEELEKHIRAKDFVITLEINGKELDSIELAKQLDTIFLTNSDIVFVIGGSLGIHDDIRKRSNLALSFSKMTFPHQLFRIILLEQLYRAFKINNNETYHK